MFITTYNLQSSLTASSLPATHSNTVPGIDMVSSLIRQEWRLKLPTIFILATVR